MRVTSKIMEKSKRNILDGLSDSASISRERIFREKISSLNPRTIIATCRPRYMHILRRICTKYRRVQEYRKFFTDGCVHNSSDVNIYDSMSKRVLLSWIERHEKIVWKRSPKNSAKHLTSKKSIKLPNNIFRRKWIKRRKIFWSRISLNALILIQHL